MANVITLKATERTEFGKGPARRLRAAGQVPAVV
ncbi:MAG: 50S ribosomal protein L25, partial [Cutibacterium granulosum]|nr:50S ribosomal protein L25 [Cutibacterium granulosum]